ncbi:acyl-CoA dehydrogenase [uncultured Arcticibacterium sp.]|uniref:acyl-CoA dehydrogenase n=1 Tax=uncultured Arcticibacterium sp. TaxID=2173042 RepID=UPI0030F85D57
MASKYFDRKTLDFILEDVHVASSLSALTYFEDHDSETFKMVLDSAEHIGDTIMFPSLSAVDKNQPELVDGEVKVHPSIKAYLKAIGEAGLLSADFSYEDGGSQLPLTVGSAVGFTLIAANNGMLYSGLTAGSARLITAYGSDDLKETYVEKMLSGKWQGTMCLTEPQAGSSLSDINATATREEDGTFKLTGQKIFISAGDHDCCDNVVHLVIARIKGAPSGSKGISLFVVPKILPNGELNDVTNVGIFHKLGQKGVPAMHLGFGDRSNNCVAYLIGQENKGLSYMFQMMNEARIGVGVTGAAIASAAYQASLEYAKERPQSRRLNEKSAVESPQIPIIQHPDVRRMLFFQKAVVEGSISLLTEVSKYYDLSHRLEDAKEKAEYHLLLELLTPIAKTYPCEAGVKSISEAVQIFGGYGFTEDFPVEQYYRDIRITPIYEGTTGIQSLDLLGRKVLMADGKAMFLLAEEINKTIKEANQTEKLQAYAGKLGDAVKRLSEVTQHLMKVAATGDVELFLSDATLYMEVFSLVTISWQWLKMASVAANGLKDVGINAEQKAFLESKIKTMQFFFHYELPKTEGFITRLTDGEVITVLRGEEKMVF